MKRGLRWSVAQYRRYRARASHASRLPDIPLPEAISPQAILFAAMENRWPGRFRSEVKGLIPGRRFRADVVDTKTQTVCDNRWLAVARHDQSRFS